MSSIKRNFVFSGLLTVSNYVYPLLVFPYISRVLGVSNIGLCGFADGVINYFTLISMMGISTVGIREIAKVKDKPLEVSRIFTSLLSLNILLTIVALIALAVSITFVPELQGNLKLMLIGAGRLIFNLFLIEWLYSGMERFQFIAIRSIILKVLYVASIYIFVHQEDDYILYYLLTAGMTAANALVNCYYARSYRHVALAEIKPMQFVKPVLTLGVYGILTSMYITFNVIYLRFVSNDTEVGYYTIASKVYGIILAVFSALTNVMLPRMSALIEGGELDRVKGLVNKILEILLGFAFPIIVVSVIFAPYIIAIVAGPGYEPATTSMRIIMPLILVVGYEQILITQLLMPMGRDKAVFINSLLGALVGVALNILLVGTYLSIGSSIVWFASECVVLISAQTFVTRYLQIRFPFAKLGQHLLYALPITLLLLGLHLYGALSPIVALISGSIILALYYGWLHIRVIKNEFVLSLLSRVLSYTHRRSS